MVSYSLLGAILDLIGLAGTVFAIVRIVFDLQPLFIRVRDSCRTGQPPEGRTLLLWSAFLILVAWVVAAALYFRYLFTLWESMGIWLDSQPINRIVYALLHLYLFFLLVCGFYGWAITVAEISQNRQVFKDLFMIARFTTRRYQMIEDLEAQRDSSSPDGIGPDAETPSAVGTVCNTSPLRQGEYPPMNGQDSNENNTAIDPCGNEPEYSTEEDDWPGPNPPLGEVITRTVYSPIR